MITNTAQRNLAEAAEIEKSSNWTIARLIASSVETAKAGRPAKNLTPGSENAKLSIIAASKTMSRSQDTIRAYLNTWNAAAEDGLCTPSSDLTPEDGWTAQMPDAEDWEKYKNPNSHSTPAPKSTIPPNPVPVQNFTEFVNQATPEQKREVVADLIRTDLDVEKTARNAVEEKRAERTERMEPIRQRAEQAQKARDAEDSKSAGFFKWMEVVGFIADAKKHIKESSRALDEAKEFLSTRNFQGEAKDRLEDSVADLVAMAHVHLEHAQAFDNLLKAGSNDWDADLAALIGGEL